MDCTRCKSKDCRATEACLLKKFDADNLMLTYHLPDNQKIVQAAADLVDNGRAGTLSRLQEIIEFSKSMNFQRVGIVYCYGMEKDAALVTQIFRESGFRISPVSCTTGGFKQSDVNDNSSIEKVSCNPLAQSEQLNSENIDMGLCLGNDILFQKNIKSYTTTLLVKDRVHNHNPIKALKN